MSPIPRADGVPAARRERAAVLRATALAPVALALLALVATASAAGVSRVGATVATVQVPHTRAEAPPSSSAAAARKVWIFASTSICTHRRNVG